MNVGDVCVGVCVGVGVAVCGGVGGGVSEQVWTSVSVLACYSLEEVI